MTSEIITVPTSSIGDALIVTSFPGWLTRVVEPSEHIKFVFAQFFAAEVSNPNTRRAYIKGFQDFCVFLAMAGHGTQLRDVTSLHISAWLEDMKRRPLSAPTSKQRLAGLRMLFDSLVRERIVAVNPAAVVRGPKYSVRKGKTSVLSGEETRDLLASINTGTLIGLRDRALIAVMVYSFARIGAVVNLTVGDVFRQNRRLWLRLAEKGGKSHEVPCHHLLENYLGEWLDASGHANDAQAPLFPTFERKGERTAGRKLSRRRLTQPMAWEMLQRRARAAGLDTAVCNHTFRATGITAYLKNGGTIERAAVIACHASTRTTQLYDRRDDTVTLEEVEKIRL